MRKIKVLFPEVEAGLGHIMPLRSVYEVFNRKYGDKVEVIKLNYFKNTGYKKLDKFGEMLVNEVKAYSTNHFRGYFATKACEFFGTTLSTVGTMIIKIPGSHIEGIMYMEDINPDVVFSTHWATNYYAENMKNKPFTIMYCPDVIMNKLFMYHADLTLLSMKPGYDIAIRYKKYNNENLRLVPFLIRNEAYDIPTNKLINRKKLNLPTGKFTLTIAEGGYGIGKLKELCEKLTKEHLPITIIAVCGKNEELKEYLSSLPVNEEVTFVPLGFTSKMLEYIASSDLFLGKSGNIISEPTFFGIPSIITGFATTIERNIGNYYINNVRSSIKEFDVDNIISLIKDFINNPKLLEPYKNNAIAYHSNYGSEYTADLIWDKIVSKNYFSKMNDAFQYFDRKHVVTSYRNSKNFGTNAVSGLYGIYFTMGCIFESRGRTVLGCSTRVQGTGYVIPSSIVQNGWKYTSLTEDWEFSVDQILGGQIIKYCDEATFYDEQPTSFKIMWRQRVRWSRGHLLVCYDRLKDLVKNLFKHKGKNKFSSYDMISNILPFCLILTLIGVIQFILTALTPLFTDLSFYDVFISSNHNILTSPGYLFSMLRNTAISYVSTVLTAVATFILERKRIQGVNIFKKILLCLIWPLFLALQFPMDVQAFFSKNLDWKPIPHEDHKTLTHI